ncbi:MAG: transporter substrate-binding domain-containing protein [Nitratireductor sp.]
MDAIKICAIPAWRKTITELLKFCHDPDFPPFSFVDEDGVPRGTLVEQTTKAMQKAGIPFQFVAMPMSAQAGALANGDVDAIAGLAITPPRLQDHDFAPPFVITGGGLFSLKTQPSDSHCIRNIATPAAGPLLPACRRYFPEARIIAVDSYLAALAMVQAGDADAASLNIDVAPEICERFFPAQFHIAPKPFFSLPLAIAVKKGKHAALAGALLAACGNPDMPEISDIS